MDNQQWNKEKYYHNDQLLKQLEHDLCKADEQGDITDANRIQGILKGKYEEQESIIRQKSKIQWLQEDDRNTRYFHSAVKRRRWKNNIQGVNFEVKRDNKSGPHKKIFLLTTFKEDSIEQILPCVS